MCVGLCADISMSMEARIPQPWVLQLEAVVSQSTGVLGIEIRSLTRIMNTLKC